MMSLHAAYLKEREGKEVYEAPEGFVVSQRLPNDALYIVDVYLAPEHRNRGLAKVLVNAALAEQTTFNVKTLVTTCVPSLPGAGNSLRAILSYGFEPVGIDGTAIVFKKEL